MSLRPQRADNTFLPRKLSSWSIANAWYKLAIVDRILSLSQYLRVLSTFV